jgi:hypothetical protein
MFKDSDFGAGKIHSLSKMFRKVKTGGLLHDCGSVLVPGVYFALRNKGSSGVFHQHIY